MCLCLLSGRPTAVLPYVLPSGALALGSVATPPFRPVVNGDNVKVRAVRMGSETRREHGAKYWALQPNLMVRSVGCRDGSIRAKAQKKVDL